MRDINTELIKINPQEPEIEAVRWAVEVIRSEGLVVLPTDTVYGLVCDPNSKKAVEGIYRVKERKRELALILLLRDAAQASEYIQEIPESAVRVMQEFWPGPLTVILYDRSKRTELVRAKGDTVGLRLPAHMAPRLVADGVGGALASTSANRSGQSSATMAEQAMEYLDGLVHLVLDGGPAPIGQESTVVNFSGRRPEVLREGAITLTRLREVLPDTVKA